MLEVKKEEERLAEKKRKEDERLAIIKAKEDEKERKRLLGQIQAGISPTKAAKAFYVSSVTVYKIISKSKQQNSLKDRRRSGRPKITNAQTDADIVAHFRDNTFKTVRSAVGETGLKKDTIRRRLFAAGLRSYRPVIKPKLTDTHKQNRHQMDHVTMRCCCLAAWRSGTVLMHF